MPTILSLPVTARIIIGAALLAFVATGGALTANGQIVASGQNVAPGWIAIDVGRPPAPGAAGVTTQKIGVISRGFDVNGAADQFTFVYRSIVGDATVITRLATVQNVDAWSLGGVMIRESLDPSSKHAYVFGSAARGVGLRYRASATSGTTQISGGSGIAPVWLKLERRSSTLTASRSADGVQWTTIGSLNLQLAPTVLVGVAVASHTAAANVTAYFESVTVNGVRPLDLTNAPPTVSLTSPAPNSSYAAPASIAVAATAADVNGTVARVDFYAGNTLIGSDATSPFSFSWTNVPAGTYTLKAVATDDRGASTTSATVNVTVGATNMPPAVSLTSPSSGTSFMAPASTTVTATATDPNGSVARVDFYAGSTLLGSDTSSPYSVSWGNVPAGSYILKAVATDNAGASTTSALVSVTVNANQVPTVSLTSPSSGATFSAPATISLTASANDVDGTVQKVEFYNGSTLIGSTTTSPFSFTWSNVAAGSYSLSAVARDNLGATAVSSWKDITVATTSTLSKAIFTPAVVPDAIDYYVFEVYAAGSDPSALPLAVQNLGVPPVVNGECTVDVKGTIAALAPGNYFARVSSMSAGEGMLRSAPFTFTR